MDSLSIDEMDALDRIVRLMNDAGVQTFNIMPQNGVFCITGDCAGATVISSGYTFTDALQAYAQAFADKRRWAEQAMSIKRAPAA